MMKKVSASLLCFLSAIAVNFLSTRDMYTQRCNRASPDFICSEPTLLLASTIPVSSSLCHRYPLMIVVWYQIGHTLPSLPLLRFRWVPLLFQFVPVITLTNDPIANALFGGVVMGTGDWFALRTTFPVGELLILPVWRFENGQERMSVSIPFWSIIIMLTLVRPLVEVCSLLYDTVFVSSRVTDAVFTKRELDAGTIVTSQPDAKKTKVLHRAPLVHNAEGTL